MGSFLSWFRKVFARPISEISRTGQIAQRLHDVAQIQIAQRRLYRKIGEKTLKLVKSGELADPYLKKLLFEIEENELIIEKHEKTLSSYQDRGKLTHVLSEDEALKSDRLEDN